MARSSWPITPAQFPPVFPAQTRKKACTYPIPFTLCVCVLCACIHNLPVLPVCVDTYADCTWRHFRSNPRQAHNTLFRNFWRIGQKRCACFLIVPHAEISGTTLKSSLFAEFLRSRRILTRLGNSELCRIHLRLQVPHRFGGVSRSQPAGLNRASSPHCCTLQSVRLSENSVP